MDRKNLLKDFGYKLRKIRESLRYSQEEMAAYFSTEKGTYNRYENGKNFPGFLVLNHFGNTLGISMDWLICDKGPVYYKEKEKKEEKKVIEKKEEAKQEPSPEMPQGEMKELLEHMGRIPLLRHEVLAHFYKFKEEHKELEK